MSFSKPEGLSVQGFDVYGDRAFIMFHTGVCHVFDLTRCDGIPLAAFRLASYNAGFPDKRYINHANQAVFSGTFAPGNGELPLLYVSTGNSGETDDDGYISRCAVENIRRTVSPNGSERYEPLLRQTISYKNDGVGDTEWSRPGWGWPMSYADSDNGVFYLVSARYRTLVSFKDFYPFNAYIVTKFRLPVPEADGGLTVLRPSEIIDQFTLPFNFPCTQGGTLYKNHIFNTYGCGSDTYPDGMNVIDLGSKTCVASYDFSRGPFAREELECCAVWRDTLLCLTQNGKLYAVARADELMK